MSSLTGGWICRLQLLLVLASALILKSETSGTHDHILLSQIRHSPNLEGQVPVFIYPKNRVVQLHPQALGSLFGPSYDSLGYSGNIRPRLHTVAPIVFLITPLQNRVENTALLLLRLDSLLRKRFYRAVAQKRPWHIRQSRGRCITTALPLQYIKDTYLEGVH
jgi:hypothetical protein